MAMSICESFQSTAIAGLGIRTPHWAVSVRDPKAVLNNAGMVEDQSIGVSPDEPLENHAAYQALDRLSQSPLVRQEIYSVRMSPNSSQ